MSARNRQIVHTLLTLATFLFLVSGMGITEPNLITRMTFGLLTKDTSYRIHILLLYPFAALLFLHIYYKLGYRRANGSPREENQAHDTA